MRSSAAIHLPTLHQSISNHPSVLGGDEGDGGQQGDGGFRGMAFLPRLVRSVGVRGARSTDQPQPHGDSASGFDDVVAHEAVGL